MISTTVVVNARVLVDLHAGGRDIFGGAGKAGAVVGAEKVIVDRLGDAHDTALVADGFHITADLVAGIHRVVAAVIEEISDVVLLEDLENTLIVGIVFFGIGDLITAGAELGGRRVQQQFQFLRILFVHDIEFVFQNTLDPMRGTVDLGDALCVKRGADHAVGAGIDDGSGAAGLAENACSAKLIAHE